MDTKHRAVARKSIHVDGTTGEGHAAVIFRALANDTRVVDPSLPRRSRRRRQPDREGHGLAVVDSDHARDRARAGRICSIRSCARRAGACRRSARGRTTSWSSTCRVGVHDAHDAVDLQMPIGGYSDFVVEPTCGLVSATGLIGFMDDPSAFYEPDRLNAQLLWFRAGYVEYRFPESRAARCPSRVSAADRGDLQRGAASRPRLAERHHGLDQRGADSATGRARPTSAASADG